MTSVPEQKDADEAQHGVPRTWHDSAPLPRQIPPVGPHPGVDVLLVGALMWAAPADAGETPDVGA